VVAVKRLEPRRIINDQCAYSLLIMNWKSEGHAHETVGRREKRKNYFVGLAIGKMEWL
jgi:hypothetical protein